MSKLKTITLTNYQSHKSSELHFDEGINVIVGSSKSGKTSVLRGIRSIMDNRPLGIVYNSYWNRDKNGKPIKEHSSSMDFGDIAVYRKKSKDFNGYIIGNGIQLEAIGNSGAPDEILKTLNLSTVNFQRQFDAPFLLAESPAEIGRFFNKIVNLDLSDRVLAKAEDKRKKTNSAIKESKEKIEQYTEEIKKYDWLPKAKELINSIDRKMERLDRKVETRNKIDGFVVKILAFETMLRSYPKDIDKALKILEEIGSLNDHIQDQDEVASGIDTILRSIEYNEREIGKIKSIPFEKAEKIVKDIEAQAKYIEDLEYRKWSLVALQKDIMNISFEIKETQEYIELLLKDFPKVCPTCGQAFKGEMI